MTFLRRRPSPTRALVIALLKVAPVSVVVAVVDDATAAAVLTSSPFAHSSSVVAPDVVAAVVVGDARWWWWRWRSRRLIGDPSPPGIMSRTARDP